MQVHAYYAFATPKTSMWVDGYNRPPPWNGNELVFLVLWNLVDLHWEPSRLQRIERLLLLDYLEL